MAAPTVYRSTDASAPSLDGTVGSLTALLDACLVSGYGSKTAAGWSKPYTSTNAAVFRMGGGLQMYLQVDDNGPGAGGAKEARAWGFESMTAYNTATGGTVQFPASGSPNVIRKSATADATAREWLVVADDMTFHLLIRSGDSANVYLGFCFGQFAKVTAGDSWNCLIMGRTTENSSSASVTVDFYAGHIGAVATITGHSVPRTYNGTAGPNAFGKAAGNVTSAASNTNLTGPLAYPNPCDGSIYLVPLTVVMGSGATAQIRGRVRGMFQLLHDNVFTDGDTFSGDATQQYAGRTFLLVQSIAGPAPLAIETTEWETVT